MGFICRSYDDIRFNFYLRFLPILSLTLGKILRRSSFNCGYCNGSDQLYLYKKVRISSTPLLVWHFYRYVDRVLESLLFGDIRFCERNDDRRSRGLRLFTYLV